LPQALWRQSRHWGHWYFAIAAYVIIVTRNKCYKPANLSGSLKLFALSRHFFVADGLPDKHYSLSKYVTMGSL
jgi:hypothetical protein